MAKTVTNPLKAKNRNELRQALLSKRTMKRNKRILTNAKVTRLKAAGAVK